MPLTPESLLDKALNLEMAGDLNAARVLYEQVAECDSAHAEIAKHNLLRLRQQPSAEATEKENFVSSGKPRKKSGKKRRTQSWNWRVRPAPLHPGFVIGGLLLASVIFIPSAPTIGVFSLIGGLVYTLFVIFGRQDCDLCGVRTTCRKYNPSHEADQNTNAGHRSFVLTLPGSDKGGFALCPKCLQVAQSSNVPVSELITQAITQRQVAEFTTRNTGGSVGIVGLLVLVGLVYGAYTLYTRPEKIRIPGQVPITVSVRSSLVGLGNVIQIANKSDRVLKDVVVILRNPGKNSEQSYRVGDIEAQEVRELGTIQSGWVMEKGEMVYVVVGDALPIAFSAEQLGIE